MPLRLFLAVPMTISAAGDSFAERTYLCRQDSLSPVENFISGVLDTGKQFIAGVVDNGEQFMTLAITFFSSVVDTRKKKNKKPKIYRLRQ